MITYQVGTPNVKQMQFFKDHHKYVGYGGARGGGKSWAIRKKTALLALYYAGIKIGIYRRTYPELRNNHVVPLLKELNGVASYNESKKVFSFPNGSVIELCYADNLKESEISRAGIRHYCHRRGDTDPGGLVRHN